MLAGGVGPRGSTAAAQTAETTAAALAVLRNSISVDVHSHGGSTGITSKAPPSGDLAGAMRAGSLAVACVANVPDWPVLARSAEGGRAAIREPARGELYRYHLDRLAWMDELARYGALSPPRSPPPRSSQWRGASNTPQSIDDSVRQVYH
jgi:membrane dipeptidase